MTNRFRAVFKNKKPVIGMIHVHALPGTPNSKETIRQIIDMSINEAEIYKRQEIEGIIIENMHDLPYLKRNVGPEITSAMSVIGYEIKNYTDLPCGIQILAGVNKAALACAYSSGLDFIRAEGFVFAHVADEGLIESDAAELLRYRRQIDADKIAIFTDIKKKHSSHSITADVDISSTASAAKFFMSDAVIISGNETGEEPDLEEMKSLKENTDIPVIIGSGITRENISKFYPLADGFIVGSHFKKDGNWFNDVDESRVNAFMDVISGLR